MIRRMIISLVFVLFSLPLVANDVELKSDHPLRYTVVKGDTLWDISGKFLKYPWHWPDIWYVNPQVENPHLIYPGDELILTYCDGKPCLMLNRGTRNVKLSPEMREIIVDKPITTIPLAVVGPFLSKPRVVGEEVLDTAPYVVSSADERLISGAGDYVYAKGVEAGDGAKFSVFEPGEAYIDPITEELLGYEAIYAADAVVNRSGEPSKIDLLESSREVKIGNRLLEIESENYDLYFTPRAPEQEIEGVIMSVFDGVSQVGQYEIVVINKGLRDGLETGHVLAVHQAGDLVKDQVTEDPHDTVQLPDEYVGEAMIFKLYDKVSYALIMRATHAIHVMDKVKSAP